MQKRSLFYKFFLSYIALGLVAILFFGIVFYYFNSVSLNTEIRNNHFAAVNQSLQKVDYLLESMTNVANLFSASEIRQALSDREQGGWANFVSSQLDNYEQNMAVPAKIMIYSRGDTKVYLSDSEYPYHTFEESIGADLTMSRLFTVLNSSNYMSPVRLLPLEGQTGGLTPSAAFVYPIPYMDLLPDMSMAFFVSDSEFRELFDNYTGDSPKNIYLLDEKLQLIYGVEDHPITHDDYLELIRIRGTGVFDLKLQGHSMVAVRALSNYTGYSLVMMMEESEFFSRTRVMKSVIGMCVVMFIALFCVLAFLMALRHYRPIRALMSESDTGEEDFDTAGNSSDRNFDELAIIRNRIQKAYSKNQELGRLIDMQRPYIVHACIESLLRGPTHGDEDISFQMRCANLHFPHAYVQVLLIIPTGKSLIGEKLQAVLAVCEKLQPEGEALYCTENVMERQVALVLNTPQGTSGDGVKTGGLALAAQVQAVLREYGVEASIGLGGVHRGAGQVHTSFVEAMVVVNEYLPSRPGDILCFAQIPEEAPLDNLISFTEQAMLMQALKQGDAEVAVQTLDKMVDDIAAAGGSFLLTQYQCFDISNTLIKVLKQSGGEVRHADLQALSSFMDLEEFRGHAGQLAQDICHQVNSLKEQKNSQLSADLIRHVNENYRDADLSLEGMANHFDLSSGYLSRFFKQATGCNFIQYVTLLRMDYVKERLVNSDDQVKDIVAAAGYFDSASFVRKFKAAEGITPGQYRRQMRGG